MRNLLFLLLLAGLSSCAQITLEVERIPVNTPRGSRIYVAGIFNFWDPGDPNYTLSRGANGKYYLTLPRGWGKMEYKFTRGDWTTVEQDPCGNALPNRSLAFNFSDTVKLRIESWEDLGSTNCDKVTFLVKPPKMSPKNMDIHIAGTFNGWAELDPLYALKKTNDSLYSITLRKSTPGIEFKFTRGGWETEELDELGNKIQNRIFSFGTQDTVRVTIPFWKDMCPVKENNVTLMVRTPTIAGSKQLYVAGSFNNWDPVHPAWKFVTSKTKPGYECITVGKNFMPAEYKLTRGSWETVEVDGYGRTLGNRQIRTGVKDTMYLTVRGWRDQYYPGTNTPRP